VVEVHALTQPRTYWTAGILLCVLTAAVSGAAALPFATLLLAFAGIAYGVASVVAWAAPRASPAPVEIPSDEPGDRVEEGTSTVKGDQRELGVGPAMTYNETLSWLLEHLGEPVGITVAGRENPSAPTAAIPAARIKGTLEHAQPDPGVEQESGEALEFTVGDHGRFSIGWPEFRRAERSETPTRGAMLDFAGGTVLVILLDEESWSPDLLTSREDRE